MVNGERARRVPAGARVVGAQRDDRAHLPRALSQQIAIRQADQLAAQRPPGNRETQLRTDTGRLAGGQRNAWQLRTQSLDST
jgi:hypothetical protein